MGVYALFHDYAGTGLIFIWYFVALIYLFFAEKRKDKRILFLYAPLITLILFFNPLFYRAFGNLLGGEIFYRFLWTMPVTVTLAYCVVRVCQSLKGRRRVIFGCASILLVIVSGTLTYSNPGFSKAENIHHVPREVVEICDAIEIPGIEVMAAFPMEMLHYVRQYSTMVCMPYGREVLLNYFDELEYVMHYPKVDVARLAELAKARNCHYVILSEEKELIGQMEDYDYVLFGQVGKYLIYKDPTRDYYLPREE